MSENVANNQLILKEYFITSVDSLFNHVLPDQVNTTHINQFKAETLDVSNPVALERDAAKFLQGMDYCITAAAVSEAFCGEIKKRLDSSKALARFERVYKHFEGNSRINLDKLTETSKDAYCDLDPEVVDLTGKLAKWKALKEYFSGHARSFEIWHNWCKKAYERYGAQEPKSQYNRA